MASLKAMKPNAKVGNETGKKGKYSKQMKLEVRDIFERGETLGGVFIEMMMLTQDGPLGLGMCAVAMARALAALKSVAKSAEVDIDDLYQFNLQEYERLYEGLADDELRARKG